MPRVVSPSLPGSMVCLRAWSMRTTEARLVLNRSIGQKGPARTTEARLLLNRSIGRTELGRVGMSLVEA